MSKYYLGCDVSLRSGGYAIIKEDNGVLTLEKKITIKTDSKMTDGQALEKIYTELLAFTLGYQFEAVIREKGFSRFNNATQQIFKALGIVHLAFSQYDIIEISPTTIKKVIGGHGKAEKMEVLEGVCNLLNLPKETFILPPKSSKGKEKIEDDITDAIACVLTHLQK